jgi:hypothetical protein
MALQIYPLKRLLLLIQFGYDKQTLVSLVLLLLRHWAALLLTLWLMFLVRQL